MEEEEDNEDEDDVKRGRRRIEIFWMKGRHAALWLQEFVV